MGQRDETVGSAVLGERFDAALLFASAAHRTQRRKGSGAPYVSHPLAVAASVVEYGGDEDQAIAALLHDVMEDSGVSERQIEERFGARVARIVAACTDSTEQPKPPWKARKVAHLARVRTLDADARLVIAADKLHNAETILRDLGRASVGERVWERFRAQKDEVLWYYRAMVDALGDGWQSELWAELDRAVRRLGAHARSRGLWP
jgi:GTP pyrophosphokinase